MWHKVLLGREGGGVILYINYLLYFVGSGFCYCERLFFLAGHLFLGFSESCIQLE